jgi:hypothetical protein
LIAAWQVAFSSSQQREAADGRLDGRTKEFVVLKTAIVDRSEYSVRHNAALGAAVEISRKVVEALRGDYQSSEVLTERDKAVVRWAE